MSRSVSQKWSVFTFPIARLRNLLIGYVRLFSGMYRTMDSRESNWLASNCRSKSSTSSGFRHRAMENGLSVSNNTETYPDHRRSRIGKYE